MERENKWIGLIILAIVAIVAVVGLILLFRANITGQVLIEDKIPTAGELELRCTCKGQSEGNTCAAPEVFSYPITEAAKVCKNSGSRLEYFGNL